MSATKIMVIRHAEKPGKYDDKSFAGVSKTGKADPESLVTLVGSLLTVSAPRVARSSFSRAPRTRGPCRPR